MSRKGNLYFKVLLMTEVVSDLNLDLKRTLYDREIVVQQVICQEDWKKLYKTIGMVYIKKRI
jgi:hypothetical protein